VHTNTNMIQPFANKNQAWSTPEMLEKGEAVMASF
jgi:hypothetical protein